MTAITAGYLCNLCDMHRSACRCNPSQKLSRAVELVRQGSSLDEAAAATDVDASLITSTVTRMAGGTDGYLCERCDMHLASCTCPNGPHLEVVPPPPAGDEYDEHSAGVAARAAELRALLVTTEGLDSIPPPQALLDGILFRDSLAWLHGKPGHGKSFVSLDWAGSIAGGIPWQRHEVVTKGPVVYIVAEGASGVRERVRAWESNTGTPMDGVTFLPVAIQLLNYRDREAFALLLAELQPVLVIVDTQARVTVGAEENSAKDMGELVAAADQLRQATRACILMVHHESRAGDTLRGSTALEGAATTVVRVSKDGPHLRLDCAKQKDIAEFDPLLLRLTPCGDSAVIQSHDGVGLAEELSNSEAAILECMRDSFGTTGASGSTLRDVSGVPKTSFYRALNLLVMKGILHNTGTERRPFYVVPGSGDEK